MLLIFRKIKSVIFFIQVDTPTICRTGAINPDPMRLFGNLYSPENPMKLFTLCLFLLPFAELSSPALGQEHPNAHNDSTAYSLPKPEGWGTEEFALPPGFAEGFSYKGVEDIRFAPGWGKKDSANYWSYAYLWWLEGSPVVDATTLQKNLETYYTGLPKANNVPNEKLVPARANLQASKHKRGGSWPSYEGSVSMVDYMTQKPITLNVRIYVKDCKPHTALFVEVSPQATSHPVWREMDVLRMGLQCREVR